MTLLSYMPRFSEWIEGTQQLRPNSKRYYLCGLEVLRRSVLAHMPLSTIHEDVIDTTVFQEGSGRPASAHLANQALATLRRLLNKAKRWGDLHEVPLVKLRQAEG